MNKSLLSEQTYAPWRAQDMKELQHHGSRKCHSVSSQFKLTSSDPSLSPAPILTFTRSPKLSIRPLLHGPLVSSSETVAITVPFPSLRSEQSPWCQAGWDWLTTQIQILTFAFTFPCRFRIVKFEHCKYY